MSRLELLEMDEIPEDYHYLFSDEYLGDRNVFRAWANNPAVLEATMEFLETLYDQLTDREKELVILTVARGRDAKYEWHQHVDIARDAGVTMAEMRAIGGGDLSVFQDGELALLQYANAEERDAMTDRIHEALARHYEPDEIVAIGLLVDFYLGLCNDIDAMGLPFEGGEFVGWEPTEERVAEIWD